MVKPAGLMPRSSGIVDDVAVDVDGDEIGRGDLFEPQAVGVDQKAVMAAGQPGRDMGVDAVVEAEPVNQPVGGGEIDPGLLGSVLDGRGRYVRCHYRNAPFLNWSKGCTATWRMSKTKLSTIDD